ncbi:uncharacterized protein LOC134505234 isoform X2 [Candoia aspera]|uniref:uncharacterized protein LOC134505234 isoform X2 n=1 Tax=Candoia aspera TaxID=51853 RepID=UPI002FD83468
MSPTFKSFVLNAAWEKIKRDPLVWSASFLSSWFQETMHPYLVAVNTNILDCMTQIPITCDGFRTIVQALDSVYLDMDNSTRQLVTDWIGRFLTVFRCQKRSAKEWIQSNWKRFQNYASYNDLMQTWSGFDGFATLDVLTASQLAQLTVTHGVLSNITLMELVAQALNSQSVLYIEAFLDTLSTLPLDLSLDHKAVYLALETILAKVNKSFPDLCSSSLKDLLQIKLVHLLPFADARIMMLFPTQIGCMDFHNIYKGLNSVYYKLDPVTQLAVFHNRLNFLEGQLAKEGVACTFTASNSRDWLHENFGLSSRLADYSNFVHLNPSFNGFEVLDLLTATQVGTLVALSGILTDSTRVSAEMEAAGVMDLFQSRNVSELQTFLLKISALAEQNNLVEITNMKVRAIMLKGIFQILKPHFFFMRTTDLELWFSRVLTLYLPSITAQELTILPSLSNCTHLYVIVKGLDYVFDLMLLETKTEVAQWITKTLQKIGLACGHPTQSFRDWLQINLGNFSRYADYQDLLGWNLHFDRIAVLEYLSPSQLASFTLESGAISNKEHMCQILTKLQNKLLADIYEYLDQFNTVAQKLGITSLKDEGIQKKMLLQFLEGAETTFSQFSPGNWTHLLSTRLAFFLPSTSGKESQQILSYVSSCDSFRAVVPSLSQVYPFIPLANRKGIYSTLFAFLDTQHKITGFVCSSHTRSVESWLQDHLGPFAKQAPYEDFTKLLASFSAFEIKDNLTSTQLAHVFFGSNILDDPDMVRALLMPLENRPLEETVAFVTEFALIASQRGVMFLENTDVMFMMLEAFFYKMQDLLPSASVSQYKDWFQNKLTLWLPSINASTLAMIPKSVPCGSFKTIMAGLDGSFPQMLPENCQDVYKFVKDYLTSKISQGGDPCIENTRGSLDWLNANFKRFSKLATYQDLVGLNPDFNALDAVAGLSPSQLANYMLASGIWRDTDKARKVFGALDSQDTAEFMDVFNAAAKQHHLSQLPHLETRRFILGEIFCHLSGLLHLFTAADYDVWFGQRLHLFLSSLDAQNLGFLPSDLTCDSLAAIVNTLKDHHGNSTFENPEDIFYFIKRVLHFQVQNSGSACTQDISTDRQWLARFFGPFTIYGSYLDFTALKSNFRGIPWTCSQQEPWLSCQFKAIPFTPLQP